MKKIVILNSPLYEEKTNRNVEDYLPPIGLGLIYSKIEMKYDVQFIDSLSDDMGSNDIVNTLSFINPDYVCINIFTTNYLIVKNIVENSNINTHWIIGGISTKSLFGEIFKWATNNRIDIVYGDGELIVEDIIESKASGCLKAENDKRRFYVINPKSKYYVSNISNEVLNRSIFKHEPQVNTLGDLEVCIYISRGCPYNCTYCVAAYSRNKELGSIRRKNKNGIINELTSIKSSYPSVIAIRILDDLFLFNEENFKEALSIFNLFSFSWRAMCHIKSIANINDDLLEGIAKSGCNELFIGIESGSPNILNKIHKTDNIDLIISTIKRVINAGISVKGYFICGFPYETEEDLCRTLSLATLLTDYSKLHKAKFRNSTFQFRPYYGTELYDEIIVNNSIPVEYILTATKISKELNNKVRHKSFNFDSGNYSFVNDLVLQQYINKMNNLND
jgi:anaerobic magnesium-protoporphyrin IX monomethyl ester cyclase